MQTEASAIQDLTQHSKLLVKQVHELGEWVGFETRNKYRIQDELQRPVGFAAEQQKGIFGFLMRQFLGHWRSFEIQIFDMQRQPVLVARHPFRFLFQRLEVHTPEGERIGAIQQRFSILSKRFDVEDERGRVSMRVSSPLWKIWSFPFVRFGKELAVVKKNWSGLLSEVLTDRDDFVVEYFDSGLSHSERALVLAAAIFVDLQYFERKARN